MASQNERSAGARKAGAGALAGIRVIELADEQAEYCGLTLAGLGADVIKVEPPGGNSTRRIGPFYEDKEDIERSLFFWQYNRGKRSIVLDLDQEKDRERFCALIATADVLLETTPKGYLDGLGLGIDTLRKQVPQLIVARVTPFGDEGPWSHFKGCDLVHLALGDVMMNCGYDPAPGGKYDLPPIAPQMWHALVMRQTCRHAREGISPSPSIAHTKDGRWVMAALGNREDEVKRLTELLGGYGIDADDLDQTAMPQGARFVPGTGPMNRKRDRGMEAVCRFVRAFTYENVPWREAQEAGMLWAPLRKPHES